MNKLLIAVIAVAALLGAFVFVQNNGEQSVSNFKECVAAGNLVMESYPRQCRHGDALYVEELPNTIGQACTTSAECQLPMEYAVRSNCPYQAFCREGACVVACPMWDHSPNPEESISYKSACSTSNDCTCDMWDREGEYPCECLDGQCASVVE